MLGVFSLSYKENNKKSQLRYVTLKSKQTFIQVIQSILYTVQPLYATCMNFMPAQLFSLENKQLKPLMLTNDQSESTSDKKCKYNYMYYVLKFCDRL